MSTATTSTTTWAAVAALGLVSAVVLVGGAMNLDASQVDGPPPGMASETGDAAPFTGASGGCTLSDPTGTGGCVTPAMAWTLAEINAHFGKQPASCWSARGGDPHSDHPKGRACDITFGTIGKYPDDADTARGWTLATWLVDNADALHVSYVIWQGHIWSTSRSKEGWRIYTGGGVYNPTGPTGGHYDHVHVSVLP
ncbi:hypothetical protein ACUN7V_08275 [Quadrisphaera oryzae]|uniref:hypothetical protein n=1 Tax=Quadrisphaera TaxID=317661 RepID=UPI001645CC99|nr:hypothetical protein [Quadrisphaera sp. RL12-1S]MBC3763735.1 hypothetical protein [Quadrisphaera sp. RL12-1S]